MVDLAWLSAGCWFVRELDGGIEDRIGKIVLRYISTGARCGIRHTLPGGQLLPFSVLLLKESIFFFLSTGDAVIHAGGIWCLEKVCMSSSMIR